MGVRSFFSLPESGRLAPSVSLAQATFFTGDISKALALFEVLSLAAAAAIVAAAAAIVAAAAAIVAAAAAGIDGSLIDRRADDFLVDAGCCWCLASVFEYSFL